MRERERERGGGAERGCDSGDDLERNARGAELFDFFAATAEDHRVAALEAHDVASLLRALDDERVNASVVMADASSSTADADALCSARGDREDGVGDELVVREDVAAREELVRAHGEELWIAGTC